MKCNWYLIMITLGERGGGGGGDIKMCMALFNGKQHFQICPKELLTSTNYYNKGRWVVFLQNVS